MLFFIFIFFCCRDYCKVGNSGITNLLSNICVWNILGNIIPLWIKNCDECLSQPVSVCMCPDQYKYINQIKQEGLFCEKFIFFFFTKTKAENRSYWVFRDSLLTWPWHVTDFRVSRGHKTLWWLEILTKRIQNRSQRSRMHFNSAFSPWRKLF